MLVIMVRKNPISNVAESIHFKYHLYNYHKKRTMGNVVIATII